MIIAIDGPAASGKGTLAKRLAAHFGLPYLDTGMLYRGMARQMLDEGMQLENVEAATSLAKKFKPNFIDNERLRGREMGEAASVIAAYPLVREALLAVQRDFVTQPDGAVLDGRDIGTVICPEADIKLFVTASPEVRAQRRTLELRARGEHVSEEAVLADIRHRDMRDSERSAAPLIMAADAIVIDTSHLDVPGVMAFALAEIERKINQGSK